MSEHAQQIMTVGELISSLVRVETPNEIGLLESLERMGYEMDSFVVEGKGRLILFRPEFEQESFATLALVLSRGGIFHAPEYDRSFEAEETPKEARLSNISVNKRCNEVQFSFEDPNDLMQRRFIKLSTQYNREKWGNF